MNNKVKRDGFASKLGALAALAGSAIGLGNIWKFPYMVGQNGGSAFIIIYLLAVAMLGIPIMLSEFVIGRKTQKNTVGAFGELSNNKFWKLPGYLGVICSFLILSFYGVVGGWSLNYIYLGITNKFVDKTPEQLGNIFNKFVSSSVTPIFWQVIFMLLTAGIVLAGIKNGIEKYTKLLMPMLLIIIIVLDIRALTLPGAGEGLKFLFNPDFSKLSGKAILEAVGHAFFSLSLGTGTMITYGSYISKENDLGITATQVVVADTLVALLAGVAIFPAVFAFGISPTSGPGLVFITLPTIFQKMIGGQIFLIIFFLLLVIAALTSSISILEVVVAYFREEFKVERKKITILISVIITILGSFCSMANGILSKFKIFGKNLFDIFDFTSSTILIPIGSILILVFTAWIMTKKDIEKEINLGKKNKINYFKLYLFLIKFIAPIVIFIILLNGLGVIKL